MGLEKPHTGKQLTDAVESQWHKICALLMVKQGLTTLDITAADIRQLEVQEKNTIVMNANNERIRIMLVDEDEATRLVIKHAADGKLGN